MRATTLMLGIEEAISKTNGDGLDTGLPQNPDRIAHRGLVERGFARQKGATTQLHRARVLEVRIQSPPAENPQTIGSSAAEPIAPRSEGSWRELTTTLISAGSYLEDWFCFAGEVTVTLVKDAILAVHQGEFVAITGASGSAKSHFVDPTHWLRGRRGTRSQIPPSRNKRATSAPRRSRPSAKRAPPAASSEVFGRCRREWDRGFESGLLLQRVCEPISLSCSVPSVDGRGTSPGATRRQV